MSQTPPPGYTPPKANAWKRNGLPWIVVALAFPVSLLLGLGIAAVWHACEANHNPEPAKMVAPVIEYDRSTGGVITTKGDTTGPSIAAHGPNVNMKDLRVMVPLMKFDFGSIGGASLSGSIDVTEDTAKLLKWVALALCLAYAVSGAFKWAGKDYVHAIGQWLAAAALGIGAVDTDILGWCFVISSGISFLAHIFPSAAAKTQQALTDYIAALWAKDPAAAKDVAAEMTGKSAVVVAKAGG